MIQQRRSKSATAMLALAATGLAGAMVAIPAGLAADAAAVFMYHRFGETAFPSTNVRLPQFEEHVAELRSGRYAVLPVPEIVARLRGRQALPENTIGLTIDDAFLSVYTEAWPRLRAAGLPFTLFVATDPVDNSLAGMMTWDQIRELARAGVTIGAHTASHLHMPDRDSVTNRAEIEKSNARFKAELGAVPTLFAYPYGEMSRAIGALVAEAGGYIASFGQHSGVLHAGADFQYLPRFAINEHYGGIDRFRLAARTLPLPVTDLTPADPLLSPNNNPPPFGFTVGDDIAPRIGRLACYASHEGRTQIERLGDRRIEVRMTKPFPPGRGRVNCTMPEPDNRWRWFGIQFYVPQPSR